jgi:hypothetical protein
MTARLGTLLENNPWRSLSEPLVIGKDILDLLSTSMYVDPLCLYREYIQNAADAIDNAHAIGVLGPRETGSVVIVQDLATRSIRIRDNGSGISYEKFEERLSSFGSSEKRGTRARGFRGIGRLAGLGYCQELIFRSRASGDSAVREMKWDCRRIKSALRSTESLTLDGVVDQGLECRDIGSQNWPEHFFEAELRGVVRVKNDDLMNPQTISTYLSQVAPVPFSPQFSFGDEIQSALRENVALGNLDIRVQGLAGPIYKPHRNVVAVNGIDLDEFLEFEVRSLPSLDGGRGAICWILHHNYKGAFPLPHLRGLRVRSGNIQVGNSDLFQELFAEPRFNSWSVGEIHIIDQRIVPNGRRDHFEQNVHFNNLTNQIGPIAKDLSARCRKSSVLRNRVRDFEKCCNFARENLLIAKQGSVGPRKRRLLIAEIEQQLDRMRTIAAKEWSTKNERTRSTKTIRAIERQLRKVKTGQPPRAILSNLSASQRKLCERLFELIYECSNSRENARHLVEKIMSKLA